MSDLGRWAFFSFILLGFVAPPFFLQDRTQSVRLIASGVCGVTAIGIAIYVLYRWDQRKEDKELANPSLSLCESYYQGGSTSVGWRMQHMATVTDEDVKHDPLYVSLSTITGVWHKFEGNCGDARNHLDSHMNSEFPFQRGWGESNDPCQVSTEGTRICLVIKVGGLGCPQYIWRTGAARSPAGRPQNDTFRQDRFVLLLSKRP